VVEVRPCGVLNKLSVRGCKQVIYSWSNGIDVCT
jgi:hypothetical protein